MLKERIEYLEEVQIKRFNSRVTHSGKPQAVVAQLRVSHFGACLAISPRVETERELFCGAAKRPSSSYVLS
jgi:hypothetical protein